MSELFTAVEIAEQLSVSVYAVKKRLQRMGIKPVRKYGPTSMYDTAAIEAIRNTPRPGFPARKDKPESEE